MFIFPKGGLVLWALLLSFPGTFADLNLDVPNCIDPSFNWTNNQESRSPCLVAAALESTCRGDGTWKIPAIKPNNAYNGPESGAGNKCECSSVVYSLLSACSLCQGGSTNQWTLYNANCSQQDITLRSFVFSIPTSYSVPTWAYEDVTIKDTFDANLAEQIANEKQPDITIANATSTASNSSKHSKGGAIAGGVVGGIAFLCIVAGAAFYFFRRKKKNAGKNNQAVVDLSDDPKPAYLMPTPYYPPGANAADNRVYNPSDPTTFPSSDTSSHYQHKHTLSDSTYLSGTTSPNPSLGYTVTSGQSVINGGHGKSYSNGAYKGIPEV